MALMKNENKYTLSESSDWDENVASYIESIQHLLRRTLPVYSPVRGESIPEVLGISELPDESGYEGDNEEEEEED